MVRRKLWIVVALATAAVVGGIAAATAQHDKSAGNMGWLSDSSMQAALDVQDEKLPDQILPPAKGDTEWPSFNNRLDGQRFSTLASITPDNIGDLEEACRVQISGPGPFSAGPILIRGTIYTTSAHATMAIDPTNCGVVWKTIYTPEEIDVHSANRGPAYWNGLVIRGTGDARLVAYDAATGQERWRAKAGDPNRAEYIVSAPIAWDGKIFIGLAGGDFGIVGKMMAFDARTGQKIWSFNTIPQQGEFGNDTWPGETYKTGGGGTWSSYTLDTQTGELFVPVANPAPDFDPKVRRGANLFTNSVLVLNSQTGKRIWHYQTIPNDGHDYGIAAPAVLLELDGRKLAAQASKDGFLYMLDRVSHELVWKTPVTTILNHRAEATPEGVKICPGVKGGVAYNSPGYDPTSRLLIVGSVDWCYKIIAQPYPPHVPGQPYPGGGVGHTEENGFGWVTALEAETGKIRWQYKTPAPVIAAVTPTAGGVTFAGDSAGTFYVFRTSDGKLLRKMDLQGALAGGIITYQIRDQQYVAVNYGNISRSSWGSVGGVPTMVVYRLKGGEPAAAVTKNAAEPGELLPNLARGRSVYAASCSVCHGPNGQGGEGPKLTNSNAKYTQASAAAYIANPKKPMPKLYPDVLSAQDVADVAGYIRTLRP